MDSTNTTHPKVDVYQIVTDRFIELLEKGIIPWQVPWFDSSIPMNPLTKNCFQGINVWLLVSLRYPRNLFLSQKDIELLGGRIKYGEHGHVLFSWSKSKKENGKQENVFVPNYYKVFNIDQCINLPDKLVEPFIPRELETILECESIIRSMPNCPVIKNRFKKPFYDLDKDSINMPNEKSYKDMKSYYVMLFHQLIHSTGHQSRLSRKDTAMMAEFIDDVFTTEELIAELGAGYLGSYTGALKEGLTNGADYINGWLDKLKANKKLIVFAARHAQKAVDFIINAPKPLSEANDSATQPNDIPVES